MNLLREKILVIQFIIFEYTICQEKINLIKYSYQVNLFS